MECAHSRSICLAAVKTEINLQVGKKIFEIALSKMAVIYKCKDQQTVK